MEANSLVSPEGSPNHTMSCKIDGVELLPGDADTCSRVEVLRGEPRAPKPLVIEESPISNGTCSISVQVDMGGSYRIREGEKG